MIEIDFILDGKHYYNPVEWRSLEVLATFPNQSVQPNISLENITFVNEAAHYIIGYFGKSMTGTASVYNGLPLQIIVTEDTTVKTVFDGLIDFKDPSFKIVSPVKVECNIKQCDNIALINDRLKALSYGYINSVSPFTNRDFIEVPTVIRPVDMTNTLLSLSLMEFSILSQARSLGTMAIADVGSANVVGIAADAILFGTLVIQSFQTLRATLNLVLPIPKKNKGITFRKALTKVATFLGYGFNTTIQDIDLIYLPSKTDEKNLTTGLPQSSDYEYNCLNMFERAKDLFQAKFAIVDGVLQFHNITNPYWTTLATYKIPSTIKASEVKQFNIGELVANKVYTFQKDLQDEWTIKNWTGTNCEVITNTNFTTQKKYALNTGFTEINFGLALGSYANTELTNSVLDYYRNIVTVLTGILDGISSTSKKIFKGAPNAIKMISDFTAELNIRAASYSVGTLKVSSETWGVPKILTPTPGNNNRLVLTAEIIRKRYHLSDSFAPSNPFGQKQLFKDIVVPFKFSNFIELINCSYATTYHGNKKAKVESIRWIIDKDKATIDFWVNEIFDQSLTETVIIP